MVYFGPWILSNGSYFPGPGTELFLYAFAFLFPSVIPSKEYFGLMEYFGPSPIYVLYSYFPLPGVLVFISVKILFASLIFQAGALFDISLIVYVAGDGVNKGSSFSAFTIFYIFNLFHLHFVSLEKDQATL